MLKKPSAIIRLILISSGIFLFFLIHLRTEPPTVGFSGDFSGTLLTKPRVIRPFELIGTDHKPFNKKSLKGHWTYLFFGFTRCGSICPTTMGELAKMQRLIEENKIALKPHVVMVSVDPKHDDLEKLQQYVKAFHPSFYGALGDETGLSQFAKELGVAYTTVKRQENSRDIEDIEHTGAIMVFNPKGQLAAFFTPPYRARQLFQDYQSMTHQ